MANLVLHLKKKWWEKIKSGEKTVELRKATEYWRKRLVGREYNEIHLYCGYPKKREISKLIKRKWTMIAKENVLHEEFGSEPFEVFVIDVSKKLKGGE